MRGIEEELVIAKDENGIFISHEFAYYGLRTMRNGQGYKKNVREDLRK